MPPANKLEVPQALTIPSADDMRGLGKQIGGILRSGDLVTLSGDLGAGKTTLAQGVVEGMGIHAIVTSPTFSLLNLYRAPSIHLCHCDLYRLNSPEEAELAGVYEYLGTPYIMLVEWPERLPELSELPRLEVLIQRTGSGKREPSTRTVTLSPHGGDWSDRLKGLAH